MLIQKNKSNIKQFLLYVFVGAVAFIADFSALFFFTEWAGLHYLVSAAIAFVIGLNVNYFLSKKIVFTSSKLSNQKIEYIAVIFISLSGLFLNQVSIWFLTEKIGLFYLYSKLVSASVILFYNFSVRKIVLFN